MVTIVEKTINCELTILMPCLNEENTIVTCIKRADKYLKEKEINGEILIIDNGSTDHSIELAEKNGATVIVEKNKGYGNALICGIKNAKGQVIILGDCDTTYDFYEIEEMHQMLKTDYDVVIGNRLNKNMEKGAMSLSHQIGVRFLSLCGQIRYKTNIHDFHCGLRGITKEASEKMNYKTEGMEFATEFIAEAIRNNLKITEVPITLYKSKVKRKSHLKTIPDGMRHFLYICNTK